MTRREVELMAMQTSAVGSSLLLLSMYSHDEQATGLLLASLVTCSVALGLMFACFPGIGRT
ncbi:hypothetical protein [Roseateles flavus]|uniref:Uncharacterized protein n=1 Tax=Roseateles flavus TaxID=3149041 RepID=A0ABV0GKF1_9BURK